MNPAKGEILSRHKQGSVAQSLLLSLTHRPGMTEILLGRTLNRKSSTHL